MGKGMQRQRVVFAARERAELVEEEAPGSLGPDEVGGPGLFTLVSPGTELAVYRGLHTGTQFPCGTGYAATFRVESVGPEVTGLKPGDTAFCMGNHRSHQRARAADAIAVPEGLAPETAAFARLMGVSMSTLTTTAARPPDTVLVTGLGLVGHLAAQVFAACGYDVIGVDPAAPRRKVARSHGIPRASAEIDPALEGRVALCVECSGHEAAVLDACRVVRKGGEVVLVGVPWKKQTDIDAHTVLHEVFHRYVHVRSGWEWEVPRHPQDFRAGSIAGNLAGAMRWLAEGRVNVDGLAEVRRPEDAPEAYASLLGPPGERLSVLFDWTGQV
jgi:threonine dehydrogenase-like Zn-dependent dehydrogenase